MTDHVAKPETRENLEAYLDALGVREGSYHLFGVHLDDAIVMDRRPDGWAVFHSERGGELSLNVHEHEADACADLLARVTSEDHVFFDLVAGPAPVADSDQAFDAWLHGYGVTREDLDPVDWKFDDVPWIPGPHWRRYFVRITAARRLAETP
ncbi:hypothetical protein AB0J82_11910 [Asanoa sp. NPDC049518]|uniref:hypothetical protein n=1 Tax=unclassified Asanoa TaxID=2685164 RepID=UPI00342563C4